MNKSKQNNANKIHDTNGNHIIIKTEEQNEDDKLINNKSINNKSIDINNELEVADNIAVKFALILSGDSLVYITSPELKKQIYEIAKKCEVVLACRVSPKQKADIVNLVK